MQLFDRFNLKPGDSITRDFDVMDAKGDNTEDFGDHIQVEYLYNADKLTRLYMKRLLLN